MTINQLEQNIQSLTNNLAVKTINTEFIYNFLSCFDFPKNIINRLRISQQNSPTDYILIKKRIYFKISESQDLKLTLEDLKVLPEVKGKVRLVVALNQTFMAVCDTLTGEQKVFEITDLPTQFEIFSPLIGIEKNSLVFENLADRKASERMSKFYTEIKVYNDFSDEQDIQALNKFLARILFCLFAEYTNIFAKGTFSTALGYTQKDGSDLSNFFERLFEVLNTKITDRPNLPDYLKVFPYVNGGLFQENTRIPKFTTKSRDYLIQNSELDWSQINPDIFGSMVQAVLRNDDKNDNTEHFTSVPNILKVIKPLFLDGLYEEFKNIITTKTDLFGNEIEIKNRQKKTQVELNQLLNRLSKIKFFDPAVGSANFLIITYKEIRRLEMAIIKEMGTLQFSSIHLANFYGIEINHFSAEIGKLSLWLAQHQMNVEFFKEFGNTSPTLPLQDSGNIVFANAAQINWETACPKQEGDEIYIIGNPPYLGFHNQNKEQKEDMKLCLGGLNGYKSLDYIAIWFYKSANYIRGINARTALVSTNSVCQGEQVSLLWPNVIQNKIEIDFAYESFKWQNSARGNAGVTVIIIGLRNESIEPKYLFKDTQKNLAKNINAYLVDAPVIFVAKRSTPISNQLSKMVLGNTPKDGGNLVLENSERLDLINKYPILSKHIKKYLGSEEYINGKDRWCLWLEEKDYDNLKNIDEVVNRVKKVELMRLNSVKQATREFAKTPYRFVEIRHKKEKHTSLIVPNVSSEKREYIPIGFLDQNTVISNSASAIYDPEPWIFGVICSKMHMVWVRAVGGRLKTDLRYSSSLIYNTFPFPPLTESYKQALEQCVDRVIFTREEYPELTLAQLYDPKKMPENLRQAHADLDTAIDTIYMRHLNRRKPFESDGERLEVLFEMYQKMCEETNNSIKSNK